MVVYLGLAIFELIVLLFFYQSKTDKAKMWLYILACLGLLLVVGLRSNYTGNDTIGYVDSFLEIKYIDWDDITDEFRTDYGFYYFTKFIRLFTDSPVIYLLITAFLSLFGVFDLIWRNSKSPVLSLYFYITIGNFWFILTGIRQAIAMSICMLAMRFVQNRKIIPFLLCIWLAAQMHHSAYIFVVMYFLGTRKVDIINMLINTVVTVIAYFSYEELLDYANELLDYDYGVEQTDNGLIFFAILLVVIVFAFITKPDWVKDKKSLVIMNSGVLTGIIWFFRLVGRTAERPSMYWLNTVPVMLSESVESIEDRQGRMYIRLVIIGFTLLFFAYRARGVYYNFCF